MSNANYDSSLLTKYLRDRNLFAWNFYNSDLVQQGRSVRPEQHPPVSGQVTLNRVLGGVVDYRNGVEVVPFEPEPVEEGGSTPAPPPPPPPVVPGGEVQWVAGISGIKNAIINSVVTDSLNNVYVAGSFWTASSNSISINSKNNVTGSTINVTPFTTLGPGSNISYVNNFIVKYNSDGIAQWVTRLDANLFQKPVQLAVDSDYNIYLIGYCTAGPLSLYNATDLVTPYGLLTPTSGTSAILVKYNLSGIVQWATYVGEISDKGVVIATDSDNNVYISSRYTDSPLNIYNANGVSGGTIQTTLYGTLDPPPTGEFFFLVKYNTTGIAQWVNRMTSTGFNTISLIVNSNTDLYVAGYYNSSAFLYNPGQSGSIYGELNSSGSYDCFLAKYSASTGIPVWATTIGGSSFDTEPLIDVDTAGNIIITGNYESTLTAYNYVSGGGSGAPFVLAPSSVVLTRLGDFDMFVIKYTAAGSATWGTKVSGTSTDYNNGIIVGSDNSIYVTSVFNSNPLNIYSTSGTPSPIVLTPLSGLNTLALIKYSSAGVAQWATLMGGSSSGVIENMSNKVGLAFANNYIYVAAPYYGVGGTPYGDVSIYSYTSADAVTGAITLTNYGNLANSADGVAPFATTNSFLAKYSA